ncbi:MAG: hypothetical protein FJ264_03000 [Planctomycetes bacterium]|nr:hypothetical protein [Planctomycetota bacterium]
MLVTELDNEKLLIPPLTIPVNSVYPEHAYFIEGCFLHNSVSKVESIFLHLTKHRTVIARKAFQHMNANYAYSNCWQEIRNDLRELRSETNKLRQEAEINRKMKIKLR